MPTLGRKRTSDTLLNEGQVSWPTAPGADGPLTARSCRGLGAPMFARSLVRNFVVGCGQPRGERRDRIKRAPATPHEDWQARIFERPPIPKRLRPKSHEFCCVSFSQTIVVRDPVPPALALLSQIQCFNRAPVCCTYASVEGGWQCGQVIPSAPFDMSVELAGASGLCGTVTSHCPLADDCSHKLGGE